MYARAQVLIDAVVHAVNTDYVGMAGDFVNLGFLARGTDVTPIVPALEKIWADSMGQSLGDFNFRTVTSRFNELVFQYPIRIPERYSLVIRSLLTQVRAARPGAVAQIRSTSAALKIGIHLFFVLPADTAQRCTRTVARVL